MVVIREPWVVIALVILVVISIARLIRDQESLDMLEDQRRSPSVPHRVIQAQVLSDDIKLPCELPPLCEIPVRRRPKRFIFTSEKFRTLSCEELLAELKRCFSSKDNPAALHPRKLPQTTITSVIYYGNHFTISSLIFLCLVSYSSRRLVSCLPFSLIFPIFFMPP